MLSVVVSTYNGLEKLKIILNAYENQSYRDFEVIVACDGSSDGTLEFLRIKKYTFPIKFVWQKDEGYRLARIRNAAWRIADSQRIVFTNQNILPNYDCLAHYSCYIDQEVALAGYLGWIDEKIHRVFTEESVKKIQEFDPFMTQEETRNLSKYNYLVLWSENMSLSKAILNETNGFDEDFIGWSGVDIDLGLRLERTGYLIKTLPEAKMFHLNHAKTDRENNTGAELFFKKKQFDMTIRRNLTAEYSDIICH